MKIAVPKEIAPDERRVALTPDAAAALVKDKLFARIHDLPDTLVVWVPDMAEKEALMTTSPAIFFETPHYDGYPMVLVRLPEIDDDALAEVLTESWRARAPRRLLAEFDDQHPPG